MAPWRHESEFQDFIAEQPRFPKHDSEALVAAHAKLATTSGDISQLQRVLASLQRLEPYVTDKTEEHDGLVRLMDFVRVLGPHLPVLTAEQQFELLRPLRAWIFWQPISFLQKTKREACAMVLLAHFYAVAIAVEPLFPAASAAYFGSMAIPPLEEIYRNLVILKEGKAKFGEDWQTPLNLMQFPMEMVANFRARMTWNYPAVSPSLPHNSPFDPQMMLEPDAEGDWMYDDPFSVSFESAGEGSSSMGTEMGQSSLGSQPPPLLAPFGSDAGEFGGNAFAGYNLSPVSGGYGSMNFTEEAEDYPMSYGAGFVPLATAMY
jgi:hypothetical protein